MTGDEWTATCTLLEHGWPGEFGDAARASYRILLDDLDADAVLGALKVLVRRGGTFRPSAAEIAAAAHADPSRPTFDEALRAIRRVCMKHPDVAAVEYADREHPLIGAFVRGYGLGRLRTLPIDDPEWGAKHTQDLRAAWDAFEERAEERQAHGLELDSGPARKALRRMDPLAALEQATGERS